MALYNKMHLDCTKMYCQIDASVPLSYSKQKKRTGVINCKNSTFTRKYYDVICNCLFLFIFCLFSSLPCLFFFHFQRYCQVFRVKIRLLWLVIGLGFVLELQLWVGLALGLIFIIFHKGKLERFLSNRQLRII